MWNPLRLLLGTAAVAPPKLTARSPVQASRATTPVTLLSPRPEPDTSAQAIRDLHAATLGNAPASIRPQTAAFDETELERRFVALLLHVPVWQALPPTAAEIDLLNQLNNLLHRPDQSQLVPRLPAALPRLMGLMRRADASVREVAEHVAHDPALLGEVMRLANSPRYRSGRTLNNLEDALMLLGQTGLRQLITRALLAPVFNARQGRFSRSAGIHLWEQAERCAHACAWLRKGQDDAFEAYLAGMVVNTGMIAALRLLDQHYPADQCPASEGFHAGLMRLCGALSTSIAHQWQLPEAVVEAVGQHSRPIPADTVHRDEPGLAADLRIADRCSMLHVMVARGGQPDTGFKEADAPGYRELERVFGDFDWAHDSHPAD